LHRVDDLDGFVKSWVPRILTDEDWMAKEDLVRTEYYNDFLAPQDVHSCIMVRLARRGMDTATLNITRSAKRGQFERADLEVAQTLHPHLVRAFELGQQFAADRQRTSGFLAVFDASIHGLFVLDRDGKVMQLNRAAEALIAGRRGLLVSGGRLVAREPNASRELLALIGRAASRDAALRTGGFMPLEPDPDSPPLSLTVAPLHLPSAPLLGGGPAVLVCVTDPSSGVRLPEEKLRALYGLTRAEARTAIALSEGATMREVADLLGISTFTAHNHLARVFEKTGVNRQSALVRLLIQLAEVAPGYRSEARGV
jgi:DNA-binding CsgD family transcriptional regulator/PAS domain-containing protein